MMKAISVAERKKAQKTLDTLNELALALVDHDHRWTRTQRRLYNLAVSWLSSFGVKDLAA